MISREDSRRTIRQKDRYIVLPTLADWDFHEPAGDPVPEGFSYASDTNDLWLSVEDIRNLLVELDF
jgi:UDP-N-acetylglucosamine 4,6-dehydratase